ncbi:MAG: hypothetical protein GAK36_00227 [Pseudomonas sp.]|nr:MAG: hypothetical protein GAK36_00227 [Pseudomonas sp.]
MPFVGKFSSRFALGLLGSLGVGALWVAPAWAEVEQAAVAAPPAAVAQGLVAWPEGWQVTRSVQPESGAPVLMRERGVRLDAQGEQALVMEVTRTQLSSADGYDARRVILQMRKSLQIAFMQQGLQAACSAPRETQLDHLPGLELVCSVSRYGNEVLQQVVSVALDKQAAYSLSYAGPSAQYVAMAEEIQAVRSALTLH